jgi:hypothetical protein
VSASVLYMSMSLDGYIAGPNDEPANPGGDGFDRLHEWYFTPGGEFVRRRSGITGAVMPTEFRSSCPVTGRRVPQWRTIRW